MKHFLKSMSAMLPFGLVTAFFWWWANGFAKQNGKGFLERQVWPLNDIYSCVGIAIGLAMVATGISTLFSSRRRQQMEAAGAMLGLTYRPEVSRKQLEVDGALPILDDWDSGHNLLEGSLDGTPIQLFDYVRISTSRGENGRQETDRHHQTVILIPFEDNNGISASIRRHRGMAVIGSLLGFEGMTFSCDAHASESEQDTVDRFNRQYVVMSPHANSVDSADDSLQQQLTHRVGFTVLELLQNGRGWSVDCCPSHAIYWVDRKQFKPAMVRQIIGEVLAIHQLLTSDSRDGPELRVSGQERIGTEMSVSSFGPLIASGCLGMVLAFGLFVPIFFMFADRAPWIVFVWPFFGMGIMMLTVYIAAKLARRNRNR